MASTHVSIKGQNLNFYLETHATTHNIYFIRLRILPRNLVHYTGVWMISQGGRPGSYWAEATFCFGVENEASMDI